jgi:hypothetical protein
MMRAPTAFLLAAACLGASAATSAASAAAPAPSAPTVAVTVDRAHVSTPLGHTFVLRTRIANDGPAATSPLVAHLNVLSLDPGTYVDPEDWSSRRTRYLGSIRAGAERTETWVIKAVNPGAIAVYVAVLPRSGAPLSPATGPTVRVDIAGRTTLDAGGILPLALGIPATLAALTIGVRLRRR